MIYIIYKKNRLYGGTVMKTWNTPNIESIDVNMTAAGGVSVTQHDGKIYESVDANGNKVMVEEYDPNGLSA